MCVAGAVALVSVAAFLTVHDSLYSQLDENLTERAVEAAEGPLVRTPNFDQVPVAFYAAANLKISVLSADGREITRYDADITLGADACVVFELDIPDPMIEKVESWWWTGEQLILPLGCLPSCIVSIDDSDPRPYQADAR